MKNFKLAIVGLALLPALAMAAPDFSGSWVRDNANSDAAPNTMYWLTRGVDAGGGRNRNGGEVVITIKHDTSGLQVADPIYPVRKYVLDGKAHSRNTDTGLGKAIVQASWQGDSLQISTMQPYGGMPGNATLQTTEVWTLSADGKTLTIATTRNLPAQRQAFKEIYKRQ